VTAARFTEQLGSPSRRADRAAGVAVPVAELCAHCPRLSAFALCFATPEIADSQDAFVFLSRMMTLEARTRCECECFVFVGCAVCSLREWNMDCVCAEHGTHD